jgi:hypothetical protein
MRMATALPKGPPLFFVSIASKGVRPTVGEGLPSVRSVGSRPFEVQGKHAVRGFSAMTVLARPPRFFVSVASKGVRSTVWVGSPNVHAGETRRSEAPFIPPIAFAQGKQGKRGKHAVPVFSAASIPFVGAQFIAPFSPRPLPKRRCLTPTYLWPKAPKP